MEHSIVSCENNALNLGKGMLVVKEMFVISLDTTPTLPPLQWGKLDIVDCVFLSCHIHV